MINQYGADAVRWFILSDSPPEKDTVVIQVLHCINTENLDLNLAVKSRREIRGDKR